MVADGFGPTHLTLARMIAPGGKLLLDELLLSKVKTASTSSLVTDSAAGATAYSCGLKTFNGGVAVSPDGKACATLLEAAKNAGMRTGVIVTSELTHATPAAFTSHSVTREDYALIGSQLLEQNLDVALGGGANIFKDNGMWDYAKTHFNLITTKAQLEAGNISRPLLGIFADSHLNYTIDKGHQPTLVEMTEYALPLLENKKGFFLLIEGSRIDHAGHDNDVAAMVHEVIAFDEALRVAVEFAEKSENTLVIVVSDHETGGLGIGNGGYEYNAAALANITASTTLITGNVSKPYSPDAAILAVKRHSNIWQAGDETYFSKITNTTNAATLKAIIANYFNIRTQTGWTTKAHTGADVSLFGFGMGVSNFVSGIRSNEVVGKTLASIMKFNLAKLTSSLSGVATSSTTPTTPTPASTRRAVDHYLQA